MKWKGRQSASGDKARWMNYQSDFVWTREKIIRPMRQVSVVKMTIIFFIWHPFSRRARVGGGSYEKCSSSCHASAQNTDLGGRASQRERKKKDCALRAKKVARRICLQGRTRTRKYTSVWRRRRAMPPDYPSTCALFIFSWIIFLQEFKNRSTCEKYCFGE